MNQGLLPTLPPILCWSFIFRGALGIHGYSLHSVISSSMQPLALCSPAVLGNYFTLASPSTARGRFGQQGAHHANRLCSFGHHRFRIYPYYASVYGTNNPAYEKKKLQTPTGKSQGRTSRGAHSINSERRNDKREHKNSKRSARNEGRDGRTMKRNRFRNERDDALKHEFESRLWAMQERDRNGVKLTQSKLDSLLGLCASSNAWDQVLEVLDVVSHQSLEQQHSLFTSCLRACYDSAKDETAMTILAAMRQASVDPSPNDLEMVVMTLCRNGKWRRGLGLLRKFGSTTVNVNVYDAVIHGMTGNASWKDALQLLGEMELNIDPHAGQSKINDSSVEKKAKRVTYHPDPTLSTYNAVLETCAASSQAEQAVQLLLSMPVKGVRPDTQAYTTVIGACLKKRHWRRAMQLMDSMHEQNIEPNTRTYNSVIGVCAKAGEFVPSMQLLSEMRKRGIKPDVITFNSVMSACARGGKWKEALQILDQCQKEAGVEADIISYTCAMRACARGGKTAQALSLLQVARDKGLSLDVFAYTSVMDACSKGGMWRRALDLLDEMRHRGIQPNGVTYSVAIAACGNGGQWERALELLHQMRERHIRINAITYNAAIAALAKASRNDMRQAMKSEASKFYVRSKMKGKRRKDENDGYADFDGSFNSIIREQDEEQLWRKALDIIKQMKSEGIKPDAFSYSSAINACGSAGRWQEALDLIKIMQNGGPRARPNRISYTAAITACGRSGEWKHAMRLFTDMKNDGLQPDRVSYNALVSALRIAQMPEKVLEVWDEMCGKHDNKENKIIVGIVDSRSIAPDIITLTDVLAALERPGNSNWREKSDDVLEEAVKRGIIMRKDSLDSVWEVDMSGMSFPVAHAACRYIFKRILKTIRSGADKPRDVTLITGVGSWQHHVERSQDNDENSSTMTLKQYIRASLRDDFNPPIYSKIPKYAQGSLLISEEMVRKWAAAQ